MRIGKQDQAFTAIATSDADSITVRGYDLCDDLIGKIDFTDYFWLLVTGDRPTDTQRLITNAFPSKRAPSAQGESAADLTRRCMQ